MMKIEVVERVWHTSTLNDEEEQKIRDYIKNNPEEFEYCSDEKAIVKAVGILFSDCEIELYRDTIDSDTETEEIKWSKFEERTPKEILGKSE